MQPGKPLELSDGDLGRLAEVTEADILAAWQTWQQSVDKRYVNLLTAAPDNPNADDTERD